MRNYIYNLSDLASLKKKSKKEKDTTFMIFENTNHHMVKATCGFGNKIKVYLKKETTFGMYLPLVYLS